MIQSTYTTSYYCSEDSYKPVNEILGEIDCEVMDIIQSVLNSLHGRNHQVLSLASKMFQSSLFELMNAIEYVPDRVCDVLKSLSNLKKLYRINDEQRSRFKNIITSYRKNQITHMIPSIEYYLCYTMDAETILTYFNDNRQDILRQIDSSCIRFKKFDKYLNAKLNITDVFMLSLLMN